MPQQPRPIEPRATSVHRPPRWRAARFQFHRSRNPVPMPFTMSQASLAVFEIGLNALTVVLDKAAAHATAKKIEPAVMLGWRLVPDMFALTRQVQVTADQAKNGAAR